MKLHLFAVAQHARNRWHNITEISTDNQWRLLFVLESRVFWS